MSKRKITIRFSVDKNGRRRAHYWGLACRWLPISIDAAELKLATGEALPDAATAPGHTDLMVTPESLDAILERYPLPNEEG
jgi:hypothetical protein